MHRRYGDLAAIFAKTRSRCHICGIRLDVDDHGLPPGLLGPECTPTIDHFIPQSCGGDDDADNLFAACWSCNSRRGDGDAELARYDQRGTYDAPMSSTDVAVTVATLSITAGTVAGAVWSKEDENGKKQFNWGAAAGTGALAAGLLALFFAG